MTLCSGGSNSWQQKNAPISTPYITISPGKHRVGKVLHFTIFNQKAVVQKTHLYIFPLVQLEHREIAPWLSLQISHTYQLVFGTKLTSHSDLTCQRGKTCCRKENRRVQRNNPRHKTPHHAVLHDHSDQILCQSGCKQSRTANYLSAPRGE